MKFKFNRIQALHFIHLEFTTHEIMFDKHEIHSILQMFSQQLDYYYYYYSQSVVIAPMNLYVAPNCLRVYSASDNRPRRETTQHIILEWQHHD